LAGAAVALLIGSLPANAQMQQRSGEQKQSPSASRNPSAHVQPTPREGAAGNARKSAPERAGKGGERAAEKGAAAERKGAERSAEGQVGEQG
jgi:hypothetical protein